MPEVVEPSFKPNPHQPRIVGESLAQMEPLGQSQKVVDMWLQLFSDILDDEKLTGKLWNTIKRALGTEGNLEESIVANLPTRNASRIQRRKRRTGREFWLNAHLDEYEIRDVMLDLGSDVNIFPKKTWEAMGKPKLFYSPIQLWMVNQYCIYPGRKATKC
jgi:hypothetical protein